MKFVWRHLIFSKCFILINLSSRFYLLDTPVLITITGHHKSSPQCHRKHFRTRVYSSYGPRQANLVRIAYASSEGSACASAQSRQNLRCSLIQVVSQEEPSDRKPDPWPLWMAGHAQLKLVMTECSKTQIRLTGLIYMYYNGLSIMQQSF